jgi:hypothetical protein
VASLIARLEAPVLECLREAGIDKSQLAEVEIVGGTSRVAIIKRKLGEILGLDASAMNYGLKTTMNSDEAVARGEFIKNKEKIAIHIHIFSIFSVFVLVFTYSYLFYSHLFIFFICIFS